MRSDEQDIPSSNNGAGETMRRLALAHLRQEALAAAQAGRLGPAQAYLQQALSLDNQDADLWALLGAVTPDRSVQRICARQALEISPDHPVAKGLLQQIEQGKDGESTAEAAPEPADNGQEPRNPFRLLIPHLRPARRQEIPNPSRPARQPTPRPAARTRLQDVWGRAHQRAHPSTQPSIRTRLQNFLGSSRRHARLAAAGLLLLLLLSNLALGRAYGRQYGGRMIPGVHVAGIDVGGLPLQDVQDMLQRQTAPKLDQVLVLRYGEHSWPFSAAQLGLHYRVEEACQEAWALGHRESGLKSWWDRGRVGLGGTDVPLLAEVYRSDLDAALAQVVDALDRPAILARVGWTEGSWIISPGQDGLEVLTEELREGVLQGLAALVHGRAPAPGMAMVVEIPTTVEKAALAEAQRVRLQEQLDWIGQPLELHCQERSWSVDKSTLASWIRVESAPTPEKFAVRSDRGTIERYLDSLAPEIARTMQPARLEMQGERVVAFAFGADGRALDVALALDQLETLLQDRLQGQVVQAIELPTEIIPAGDDTLMAELGITGLVGEGTSTFVGSPPDRATNILIGGQELHGLLVAPDQIFSLNAALDPITWEKGYRLSPIIVGGGVVMGLGGGLCQVATTLYRAALYSGLEIVERHPHAWRVDWYEQDAPPGFDATIALGGPDLKFRNNTGQYLLLQVDTRLDLGRQTIYLYGSPPGWEVTVDNLVISAGGNSVSYQRTVSKDGEILRQETFYSNY